MIRFLLYTLAGLLIGGIVHIAAILKLPTVAPADAWARLAHFDTEGRMARLPRVTTGQPALPLLDPAMAHAACRFRLDRGPVRIRAALPDGFWGLAVHTRLGAVRWSLNDRALDGRPLDMLVASPDQVGAIRENLPPGMDGLILVEWPEPDGFVLMRVLVPTESALNRINAALDAAACKSERL